MKLSTKTRAIPVAVALAGSLALAACGASNESGASGSSAASGSSEPKLSGTLNGAGSSAQQAAVQGWIAGYNAKQPNVTVNYDPVGSGGGRKQFTSGGVAFAGSDAALSDTEVQDANTQCGSSGYFELPDYISGIAVVYNQPDVKDLQLSPKTLAGIFAGKITTWNDPAIAADNPGKNLPGSAIKPAHRADNSGTTSNFTDYLSKTAPDVWTYKPSGDWPVQGGEAVNQTSGMVQAVKGGQGLIGYADESQSKDLQVAKIKVGDKFIAPNPQADAALVSASPTVSGRNPNDLAVNLNRTTTDSSQYPLVLVSYHIGCVQPKQSGAVLKSFMNYVISSDGQQIAAKQAGSAPISDAQRQKSQKVVDAIQGS